MLNSIADEYYNIAIALSNHKNSSFISNYLHLLMHHSGDLEKGKHFNIEYFLKNDNGTTDIHFYNFGQYCRVYLDNKRLYTGVSRILRYFLSKYFENFSRN